MIYQPIQSSRDFQNRILLGSTKESVHLDFKAQLNAEDPQKIAIDITAFANTLGGTLLIGVSEKTENGITTAKSIVPNLDFEKTRKVLNGQVMDLIKPTVKFETVLIKTDEGVVAAINVEPSVNLVGVCTNKDRQSFCFPYRTEFGNRYMLFSEVEKRMGENQNRMMFLKLKKYAPNECKVRLYPCPKGNSQSEWWLKWDENSDNEFILSKNQNMEIRLPFSVIQDVWRGNRDVSIRLTQRLNTGKD